MGSSLIYIGEEQPIPEGPRQLAFQTLGNEGKPTYQA